MCRFFAAKKGECMKRKTFKGYCQTDVRKFENLERNGTQHKQV